MCTCCAVEHLCQTCRVLRPKVLNTLNFLSFYLVQDMVEKRSLRVKRQNCCGHRWGEGATIPGFLSLVCMTGIGFVHSSDLPISESLLLCMFSRQQFGLVYVVSHVVLVAIKPPQGGFVTLRWVIFAKGGGGITHTRGDTGLL